MRRAQSEWYWWYDFLDWAMTVNFSVIALTSKGMRVHAPRCFPHGGRPPSLASGEKDGRMLGSFLGDEVLVFWNACGCVSLVSET